MYGETIGYIIYDNGERREVAHLMHGTLPVYYQLAEKQVTRTTIQMFEFEERTYRFGRRPVRWTIEVK
ncbi:MAG: hypothetical protein J5950_00580 [Clostridia bacterium]|nr:hypothetical protein [Clostridia bacterium]